MAKPHCRRRPSSRTESRRAPLAGHYAFNDGSYGLELTSDGGSLPAMLRALPGVTVPMLSALESGQWRGGISYFQPGSGPPQVNASGTLNNVELRLPQVAIPVLLSSARVQMTGPALQLDRLVFTAGPVTGTGDYRYVPGAARPHQFHLALGDSSAAALGTLLQPTLARTHSILDTALSLGHKPAPAWLRNMQAEGFVQARALQLNDVELHGVRTACGMGWLDYYTA